MIRKFRYKTIDIASSIYEEKKQKNRPSIICQCCQNSSRLFVNVVRIHLITLKLIQKYHDKLFRVGNNKYDSINVDDKRVGSYVRKFIGCKTNVGLMILQEMKWLV